MERKLTAILSADVKGYSRLMGEDEEATAPIWFRFASARVSCELPVEFPHEPGCA